MNWEQGFSTAFHACLVDPVTWEDAERIEILSGSVNRASTGLRQSADIGCIDYAHGSDKWLRIWMDVRQNGSTEHIAMFTGLTSAPEKTIDGTLSETTVQCYSVLKPAQDILLERGWFAAKGYIGAEIVAQLLSIGPAPVHIEGESPRLSEYIIAENGESNLSMAEKILDAIGWRLRIMGDGAIVICPQAETEAAIFSALSNDQIEPKVNVKNDWFECPNVFRAASDTSTYTAYDDDPGSILSTESRGREVWKEETSVKLSDGESLASYAHRRLKELQTVSTEITYSRSYNPDVLVSDRIRLHYPAQKLSGIFVVVSQSITLDACATTSEEVRAA